MVQRAAPNGSLLKSKRRTLSETQFLVSCVYVYSLCFVLAYKAVFRSVKNQYDDTGDGVLSLQFHAGVF